MVLVVEDSEPLARLLTTVITKAGHDAVWAPSGARAIAEAATCTPGVVLIDLHLGDIAGSDLATTLRGVLGSARLVAVSGEAPTRDVCDLFDAFLLKPVALDTLLATIEG